MLVPAILYKDEICRKFMEYTYTDAIRDRSGNYHDDVIYEILFK